jgi:hypothetical protein
MLRKLMKPFSMYYEEPFILMLMVVLGKDRKE